MILRVFAVVVGLLILSGCADGGDTDGRTTLGVFAASSLTEAFEDMAQAFEGRHEGVAVELTFGGSGALARQIADGANADVFASADTIAMDAVDDLVDDPSTFAGNRLVIVVERGNPKRIDGLPSLAAGDVVVVLCAPEVPCGRYAEEALRRADVRLDPASFEENVKAVVAKVALGEADAGIAYATDALAARDRVDAVEMPQDPSLEATYAIAVVSATADTEAANEWVEFVLSETGQRILQSHGFLSP